MTTSDIKNNLPAIDMNNVDIYPRNSIVKQSKDICNIDDGSKGGTHWVVFDGSDYFDSFGGQPDKLLIKQPPKQ